MATVTRGGRAGRRRVLAYFQRPEQASEAVRDLRQRGARARLFDAGRLEDARSFGTIGRALMIGLIGGSILGAAVGAIFGRAVGAEWPGLLVIAIIALGAFGGLAGLLSGSAAAEATRSSGQGLGVSIDVDEPAAAEVERELVDDGARILEEEEAPA